MTISIHHSSPGFYPPSPALSLEQALENPYDLSISLEGGAFAASFARLLALICRIKDAFGPQYVVVQCGVDGLNGDPCKAWNWSLFPAAPDLDQGEPALNESPGAPSNGEEKIVHMDKNSEQREREVDGSLSSVVADIIQNWNTKTLFLGGGGYNSANAARAWSCLTSIIVSPAYTTPLLLRRTVVLFHDSQTGDPLSSSTPIPSSIPASHIPLYAPTFTLDVPAGFSRDTNFVRSRSEGDDIGEVSVPSSQFANTLQVVETVANFLEGKRRG